MVAFRTEAADHTVAIASFLAIGIHPSSEVARIRVVRIAVVASFDRNQDATSYLVAGNPFVVGHILVAASFVVSHTFQVADRTWATEVDSRVVGTFLPSLVIAYLASAEEAYHPS